ncbi:MAG: DUF3365 domain-containing protein [Nitrospinae bacterium]|nr:DUF3365 domain-containing protein [Nitrospinota bacterium]
MFRFALLFSALFLFPALAFADGEVGPRASTASKELMKAINNNLLETVNGGGFASAIGQCDHDKARFPARTSQRAQLVKIARVSLKPRNPKNAPDTFEAQQLVQMKEDLAKGELKPRYIGKEVVNGKKYYRFMEAIRASAFCLNCHGTESELDKDAIAKIRKMYPLDRGSGYREGDLMGAVSVVIPMGD